MSRYLEQGGSPDASGNLMVWLAKERNCRLWHVPAGLWWDIGDLASYQQAMLVKLKNPSNKIPDNLR